MDWKNSIISSLCDTNSNFLFMQITCIKKIHLLNITNLINFIVLQISRKNKSCFVLNKTFPHERNFTGYPSE